MWKKIKSKEIFKHPRLTLIEDEVILPSGVKTKYLKYKDDGGCAVTVIAKRSDGKILIEKEYSYPPDIKMFQFPGGLVPPGEKPEIGANRELMEECKLRAGILKLIGAYFINNRRYAAKNFVYLATNFQNGSLPQDQEEEIECFWLSEREIDNKIKRDKIINAPFLTAWCLYKCKK